ncbi:MAG: polyprenyl synthetase family protein [Deltaproteobacteria bacterium]|nr:polyprenyl synthetase family protein [Deltaproteobacteria bacterium]
MELALYVSEKRSLVEEALANFLPREDEFPQTLNRAMRHSVFAGGKRIRPILLMAAAEAVGGESVGVVNAACAIELIHTYSLIHDDLPAMDDDDLRRGKPTCHKAFGEAAAILAGDALLTLAFDVMAEAPYSPDAGGAGWAGGEARRLQVICEMARAAGSRGMVGGQIVDIESEDKEIPFPLLEYIHIHKTGHLIRAAVRCGALLAGADEGELASMTEYGDSVGLAFQVADDILDVEGETASMGKNVGGDSKRGKATFPAVIGLKESRERADELVEKALSSLDGFDERAEPLREIARYIVARER